MGRYRPPVAPASPYVTPEGFFRLQEENAELWRRRRVTAQALADAAAEGDRSENAEYIYRKKELREIDRRIRYLQKRLPELRVVDSRPDDEERVYFGAWVTLEDVDGRERRYRIVGTDEFDPGTHWISVDSPLARALLTRRVDEKITVDTPSGRTHYLIAEVRYDAPDA